jgi:hypothetical protein
MSAASHDVLAELDALHEVRPSVEMQDDMNQRKSFIASS